MIQFAKRHLWVFLFLLLVPYAMYAVYSYSQTDPNLVISSNALYWNFQQSMWQLGFHMRAQSAQMYAAVLILMFAAYGAALLVIPKLKGNVGKKLLVALVIVAALSYPALSHDLFNYMFNARMVLKYQTNPHIHTAMEFASSDLWVRFMNNIDTAAPYGYGWTALSLLPYSVGFGTFNLTYNAFKLFMIAGFFALFVVQGKLAQELNDAEYRWKRWLFFLNPLVLLEGIATVHNDVWMMLPFFASMLLVLRARRSKKWGGALIGVLTSIALFLLSASIKFATLIVLPVYVLFVPWLQLPKKLGAFMKTYWADLSAVLLFLPLFTDRSQQFHPWYLYWSLSCLPFMHSKGLRLALIAFSFSSLLRYIPYLALGGYNAAELLNEKLITWGGGVLIFAVFFLIWRLIPRRLHARIDA